MDNHTISVIIPTACRAERALLLRRAINSIVNQEGVTTSVIVVINGNNYDDGLSRTLKRNSRLQVIRIEEANVSKARYMGVRHVSGDYFCFLEDDDELLPGALKKRAEILSSCESIDIAVTNGYEYRPEGETPLVTPGAAREIAERPDLYFFRGNWFASPASLFRTKTVEPELFNFSFKYFEWTYLLFLAISKGLKFHYDESLTYRKYENDPAAISKSIEYAMAYPDFLTVLEKLPLKADIKHLIRRRYATALNVRSNMELDQGRLGRAWIFHLRCVLAGGWRFIPYTRHLLLPRRPSVLSPVYPEHGKRKSSMSKHAT